MKKLIVIILVLISLGSYAQTPPRTGYLVQTAKWKFVNPVWLDSGAYITKIPKYGGQNRYLVYDSLTGKIGYRYVSTDLSGYVPYTGATADVDLGVYIMNAASFHAKGTGGAGHVGFKHQSSSATAAGNETVIFANSTGYLYSKNDGNPIEKIIGSNDTSSMLSKYLRASDTLKLSNRINLKQNTLSLTTTGTSGAATLVGATLNIPQYSGTTYTGGNGIIVGGSVIYRDSLKSTGQYGNSWQNGMYLGSSNNRSVRFRTNNLLVMDIDSNQRVNIGNPSIRSNKLNISSSLGLTSSINIYASAGDCSIFGRDNTGVESGRVIVRDQTHGGIDIGTKYTSAVITFSNGNGAYTERMRISQNGNLTIGSTASISRFAIPVAPTATANYGLFSLSNTTSAFDGSSTGKFNGANKGQYIAVNSVGSVAYNFLQFSKNGVSRFKVDSLGYVKAGNIYSNSYTPTLTGVTNVGSSQAYTCQYVRTDSVVTVSGTIGITATSNTARTTIGISLPIASNFTSISNAGGTAYTIANTTAGHGASIYADATNDRVEMDYYETHGSADIFSFSFTYRIK